jgi:DNA polymerase sigma
MALGDESAKKNPVQFSLQLVKFLFKFGLSFNYKLANSLIREFSPLLFYRKERRMGFNAD